MDILYYYLIILVHPYIALWWKSFEKMGIPSWKALVPGYNYYVAYKALCEKPWWSLLLIFPGVHLVMLAVLNVSYVRRFGYLSLVDILQGIFFPYYLFLQIAKKESEFIPATNWANSKETADREWGDHLVLFLSLPVFGHIIALGTQAISRERNGQKSKVKEWGDSILFALVAASIIRTYVFEPFQIPTGSMEKTLVVGDFLFVNKLAYGPKVPVTPLSYPLVHNTFPWINVKSYTSVEKSSYRRLPGFSEVQNNDVVVFNYPSGDTAVYDPRMPMGLMGHDYHGILIDEAKRLWTDQKLGNLKSQLASKYADSIRTSLLKYNQVADEGRLRSYTDQMATNNLVKLYADEFIENIELWKGKARKMIGEDKITMDKEGVLINHGGLIYRPVDKRENYIKRCVAIPGDIVEIDSSVLYINGKKALVSEFQNLKYYSTNFKPFAKDKMLEVFGLEEERNDYYSEEIDENNRIWFFNVTKKELALLKKNFPETDFILERYPQYSDTSDAPPTGIQKIENLRVFPKSPYINNTTTDFTKFTVPKKGTSVEINQDNIAWYERIITAYEGHQLEVKKDGIYIDNKKADTYTFEMNYYWMMGDNRYNSADSRIWGFVPEDHIVGRASLVWFSKSSYAGIRWNRLFNVIE